VATATKLFGVMDLVHTEWPRAKYWFKNLEQLAALAIPQDAWIVLDDGTRGDEVLRARGIPPERIHFLPNGVDRQWADLSLDRAAARAHYGLGPGQRVVLFLARLVASKRPLDAVRAAHEVLRKSVDAVFVFAGDGPERVVCERAVRAAGIGEFVRFLGAVPHDEVPRLMAASDLFVSTGALTNRALPTCEALLCGVPVVAYDTGDTATIVRTGETGHLIRDGDVSALADAVASLLANDEARARMGNAARRLAREKLVSWDERIAMEREIVDALIER
jgi:glycosyltransferase involved in cell wall biosynthesis